MQVLNKGYVTLVESMGGDQAVIRNARRCWRSESKGPDSDRKLIRHLLHKDHMTPFESMVYTFDVKAPIFVARQWMRHRMGSYNEESLRYCVATREYYIPEGLSAEDLVLWEVANERQFSAYEWWIQSEGMAKERARTILPLNLYTKYYWTVNGSSLMNFLALRMDKHAQKEIQQYAQAVKKLAAEAAPVTIEEWEGIQ